MRLQISPDHTRTGGIADGSLPPIAEPKSLLIAVDPTRRMTFRILTRGLLYGTHNRRISGKTFS